MAAQASAPLDLETLQAAASQDADSRKRTWFFQGMGLAALMLVGVYSAGGLAHHDGSDEPSGHDSAVAFHPGMSGIRTRGGFRSATRGPVSVGMNAGQGLFSKAMSKPATARPAVARISMQLDPSEEVSAAYRSLGIGEDDSYDDIMAAYETLKAKNAGNTKAVIKLDVAKDRVMDHRLRQRMSGSLKPGRKFGEDLRAPDAKEPLITLPPFLEEIMELPRRQYLVTNIALFGIVGLLPVFEASFVSSSIGLNFGIAMFRLYNRGAPVSETDNIDKASETMPVTKRASLLTFGICLLATALGGLLGQLLGRLLKPLLSFLSEAAAISIGASAALCLACSFFKVQGE